MAASASDNGSKRLTKVQLEKWLNKMTVVVIPNQSTYIYGRVIAILCCHMCLNVLT